MNTTTKKRHFITELVVLAETEHRRHIEKIEGEKCFNVHTFLLALEPMIYERLNKECPGFEIHPGEVSRLLFLHMCVTTGDDPDGLVFRGMPTLG